MDDESYHKEVFLKIESHLRSTLEDEPAIVFESTGLGAHFKEMLENLKRSFKVITIGIKADQELCLERIKSRDQSIHIDVSDEDVLLINSLVRRMNMNCDYEIDNNGTIEEFSSLLKNIFNPA